VAEKRGIIGIDLGGAGMGMSQRVDQCMAYSQAACKRNRLKDKFPACDLPVLVLPNQFPDLFRHICSMLSA
jgi:hypothetical protein